MNQLIGKQKNLSGEPRKYEWYIILTGLENIYYWVAELDLEDSGVYRHTFRPYFDSTWSSFPDKESADNYINKWGNQMVRDAQKQLNINIAVELESVFLKK